MFNSDEVKLHSALCNESRILLKDQGIEGIWLTENDRVDFKYRDVHCLIARNPRMFHWCGYVGIPEGHVFYSLSYDNEKIEALDFERDINYSEACNEFICHQSNSDDDKLWWFGFDCYSVSDIPPKMFIALGSDSTLDFIYKTLEFTYKTEEYVISKTKSLAELLYYKN